MYTNSTTRKALSLGSLGIWLLGSLLGCSAHKKGWQPPSGQSNGESLYPAVSYDGRYVAYYSEASNLVADDTNEAGDIFLHDRERGTTTRVSLNSKGDQGNFESTFPTLSSDGRIVTFTSTASNLVEGDTNAKPDVFVRDLQTGLTTRVSITSSGKQASGVSYTYFPAIAADGNSVAFASNAGDLVASDANGTFDVFVHDRTTGQTTLVSVGAPGGQANGPSRHATIAGNGRYVAFQSLASNLVANDTNAMEDVFVYDRETRTNTRVNLGPNGRETNGPSGRAAISHDGKTVAFSSSASNLVGQDDANNREEVFIVDMNTRSTSLISIGSTARVTAGDIGDAICCALSTVCCVVIILDRKSVVAPDGQHVLYRSDSGDLVAGDTNFFHDVFLFDRPSGKTSRVSVGSEGRQGNRESVHHGISFDGRYVAFSSKATNLVSDDTNGVSDIFLHDRESGVTNRISVRPKGK